MEFAKWMAANVVIGICVVIVLAMIADFVLWGIPPIWRWPVGMRAAAVFTVLFASIFAGIARS